MPILRVDQFGRIYESSPDREDGLGYKGHAQPVTQGDVTLGSAFAKANKAYNESVVREHQTRRLEDYNTKQQRETARRIAATKRVNAMNENRLRDNEAYQNHLKAKAVSMGCAHNYHDEMSGNRLTANGQSGINGMSRDQKAIHLAYYGLGSTDSSLNLSREEVNNRELHQRNLRNATLKAQAMENKARLQSKRR
jgi:hypothetical protein